ncbi:MULTISPECIES: hypothetical protein [unclassified Variovorax]|uniref:hypothetical protein n=1 Tax=unclassified Variovorax TaxID=663243 RepID=UPI003ECFD7F2
MGRFNAYHLNCGPAVRCCAQRTAAWCEGLPHLLKVRTWASFMSITIGSMIDTARQRAAPQPPNRQLQPPFRLIPHWILATGSRRTPRWKRLNLASTIASNDNFGHHV